MKSFSAVFLMTLNENKKGETIQCLCNNEKTGLALVVVKESDKQRFYSINYYEYLLDLSTLKKLPQSFVPSQELKNMISSL